jgi:hypothetical protein
MLEKWRSLDGFKYTRGIGSWSTLGGKMERILRDGGRTALRLSTGAKEGMVALTLLLRMTGQLNFRAVLQEGIMVKDKPVPGPNGGLHRLGWGNGL